MPARDGTGPRGQGTQTGRGMGPCNVDSYRKNNQNSANNSQQAQRPMMRRQRQRLFRNQGNGPNRVS